MTERGARIRLGATAAGAALALAGLLGPLRPELGAHLASRGDALTAACAWAIALASSAWILVGSLACTVALARGHAAHARRVARVLPFGLRRVVELALVGTTLTAVAVPASAAGRDQPVVRALPTTTTTPSTTTSTSTSTTATATTTTTTTVPAFASPAPPVPRPTAPLRAPTQLVPAAHVVRAGENLWTIAQAALLERGAATDTEIARYWRMVVAANRTTLRSGDPNLIYPGELVSLPPQPPA